MRSKILALLLVTGTLAACSPLQFHSKDGYFNGEAVVTYFQTRDRNESDYVDLMFYGKGTYAVSFSYTKGLEYDKPLPKAFVVTVNDMPKEIFRKQYVLPNFLTVTIEHAGKRESHNFQ